MRRTGGHASFNREGLASGSRAVRLALLALGAVMVSALLPAGAGAAPSWLSPTDLSAPGQNAVEPQVAVDAQGDAVAVWQRYDGTHEVVQSATRAAGGDWSAPVNLSVPGQRAYGPQVAVDPAGDAVAVWEEIDGTDMIIRAATRPAGGAWSAPASLSEGGQNAYRPSVAVDSQGDAVAAWERYDGTYWHIQTSTRAAGGFWSAAVNISEDGQSAEEAQVAVDPEGDAVAVWKEDGVPERVQSAERAAGSSTWSRPVDLSADGEDAHLAQIAVDAQGEAVAVWLRSDGSDEIAQGAVRTPGGVWSAATNLSEAGDEADYPEVAVDPTGNAVAVWVMSNASEDVVQSATRAAGGGWSAAVDLSETDQDTYYPAVAASPGGAVVVWTRNNDGINTIVQGVARKVGGTWSTPQDLSATGESAYRPQVAVDPDGDALAVWRRYDGSDEIIQAAGYDAAGPQLRGLAIPRTGTVGQPVSFSVSPLDVFSAVGQTTWSFGDGGTAAGTSAAHTYGAPGTYTVTVTSGDAVGNTSTTTGTITVAPPATPTGRKSTRARARSGRIVKVKGRAALLALGCPHGRACSGGIKLIARAAPRKAKAAAAASAKPRAKLLTLGTKADFHLAAGKHETVKITISRKARALLTAAGHDGLKAELAGSGVVGRAVVLKPVGRVSRRS